MLFKKGVSNGVSDFKNYARQMGLDTNEFNRCLDNGKMRDKVDRDGADGRVRGVSGTPAFFINGQEIMGAQPFEKFRQIIEKELGRDVPRPIPVTEEGYPETIVEPLPVIIDGYPDEPRAIDVIEIPDFEPWCQGLTTLSEGETQSYTGQLILPAKPLEGTYKVTAKNIDEKSVTLEVNDESKSIQVGQKDEIGGLLIKVSNIGNRDNVDYVGICFAETSESAAEAACTNGCYVDDKCLPVGYRVLNGGGKYCNAFDGIQPQLDGGESCQNNFQCGSNLCLQNQCVDQNLLQKVMNWFKRLFSTSN